MQVKLLRVLQEREIFQWGLSPIKIDVRIVAATNKNLRAMVQKVNFEKIYFTD